MFSGRDLVRPGHGGALPHRRLCALANACPTHRKLTRPAESLTAQLSARSVTRSRTVTSAPSPISRRRVDRPAGMAISIGATPYVGVSRIRWTRSGHAVARAPLRIRPSVHAGQVMTWGIRRRADVAVGRSSVIDRAGAPLGAVRRAARTADMRRAGHRRTRSCHQAGASIADVRDITGLGVTR